MQIKALDIHKRFGENPVLQGATLTIEKGQITCIIGGSGQGKTVLLKHLIGLMRPDQGRVELDGEDISQLSERRLLPIRRRMGVVFQSGALLKSLSVEQNVGLFLREQGGHPRAEIRERVVEALGHVDMAEALALMPTELSGGMLKRVAIARALVMRPEVIFYDEPTTGLDPPLADQVDDLIAEVSRRFEMTTVVVTHDMQSVFKIADSIHMLHGGRFIASGAPAEFLKNPDARVRAFLSRHAVAIRDMGKGGKGGRQVS